MAIKGNRLILQLLLILAFLKGSLSLILHDIDVPTHRVVGDNARLVCNFEMEGDVLYSVKWYKDDLEFYRFVPNDRPKLQVFPQKGVYVDKTQSSKQQVLLTNLSLDSTGAYKCEVSAEAPSFRTKSAVQNMVVVVVPKKGDIHGVQPKYQVGDVVNVTCFSYKSRPAASLTWRVNGIEVSPRYDQLVDYQSPRGDQRVYGEREHRPLVRKLDAQLLEYKPQVEEVVENGGRQSLETSALGLTFRVRPSHVGIGLKLECTVSIGSVYWQSFQEKIPVSPREQPVSGNWWTASATSRSFAQNLGIVVCAMVILLQL